MSSFVVRLQRSALVLLTCVLVWLWWEARIELPMRAPLITAESFDDYVYYYPMFRYAFEQLRAGEFPFWNPYQHGGSPFFATGQHLLLYPLNTLFLLFPAHVAMKWTSLLHVALAVLFTAYLARTHGMGRPAALAAGFLFAWSPALAGLIYVPHHLYGAVWIPLHLALMRRLLLQPERRLYPLLLGASLGAQYLGGYPMMCFFSVYAIAAYGGWHLATHWSALSPRTCWTTGTALALAGALATFLVLPQLLPMLELTSMSPRSFGALNLSYADSSANRWGVPLYYVTTALLPRFGSTLGPIPYVGVPAIILALALLVLHRPSKSVIFFLVLTVASALLALGRQSPLYVLYVYLPAASWFRVSARFFVVTSLGLALLSGFAIDLLWRGRAQRKGVLASAGLALSVAVAAAAWRLLADEDAARALRTLLGTDIKSRIGEWAAYLIAMAGWMGAYLRWERRRRELTAALAIGACLSLLLSFENRARLPDTDPDLGAMPPPVADFLRREQGYDRTFLSPWGGTLVPATSLPPARSEKRAYSGPITTKSGMREHIYMVSDRENLYPDRLTQYAWRLRDVAKTEQVRKLLQEFGGAIEDRVPQGELLIAADSANIRLLDLFGAKFVVEGPANRFEPAAGLARYQPILEHEGVRVFRNDAAVPRAFVVHAFEVIQDPAAVLDRLSAPDFDLRASAVLEADPGRRLEAAPASGAARIVRYTPHEVAVEVDTGAPGLLVLTDQYYPGWTAEVDGVATPVQRANHLFRAVFVDAGQHTVVFRFVPRLFYRGAVIGACGVLCLALVMRRRRDGNAFQTRGGSDKMRSS